MNDIIFCKNCKPEDSSCSRCGGHKVLLEKVECGSCKASFWDRIRHGETFYVGKTFQTFDGQLCMVDGIGNILCLECVEKRNNHENR